MRVHLQKEIEKLKLQMLMLCSEVENDLRSAVRSVVEHEPASARTVIQGELKTNALEVDIEEECLKILALHQPVANDLRYIIAILKINQDLERIGDLAVHVAEAGLFLCEKKQMKAPARISRMGDKAQSMLKQVLDAFVNLDADAARAVCLADHEMDDMHRELLAEVKQVLAGDPVQMEALLQVMHISRHIERIGDHVTNIAEDLIYMIEGRIVRHTEEVGDPDLP